jgi:conjugal transfer pilus assembly protein TraW
MSRTTLLVAALCGQWPAHADEEWLTRSQNILNTLEGQPRPAWLDSNPYQADAQRQASEILNSSKPIGLDSAAEAQKPINNDKPLRVMFISFSLGESVLKGIFEEASGQDDVLLVLRGPKPRQKLPGLFAELKALLKGIAPVPNIVIDPTRFQK